MKGKIKTKQPQKKKEKRGTESWKHGEDGQSNRRRGQNGKDEGRQENVG